MWRGRWKLLCVCMGWRVIDEHTVLATDTAMHLSDAFRYRVKDAGMTWISGVHV